VPETVVPETVVPETVVSEIVVTENVVPEKVLEKPPIVFLAFKSKSDMNLTEVLIDFLSADINKIELTPKIKKMIGLLPLMKSNKDVVSSHLENIEVLFTKILADKKVNVMDLGEIIELLNEMFMIYDTLRITVTGEDMEKVFKVLIQVFIHYKLGNLMTDDEKESVISSIYTVLSLCTQLIDLKETTKKIKKKIRFLPCF